MTKMIRPVKAIKALRQLGVRQVGLYGLYRLGVKSGVIEQMSRQALKNVEAVDYGEHHLPILKLPPSESIKSALGDNAHLLIEEAEQICKGVVTVFGNQTQELQFFDENPLLWFTDVESRLQSNKENQDVDLKLIWEAARFGWVYPLCRAYWITANEEYCEAFWHYFDLFVEQNPPYFGYHWLSAQEAAIRILAWVFAAHVFERARPTSAQRRRRLRAAIAQHAARIPCTLLYARAQNNNHLISEAAGLITAALYLRGAPMTNQWWDAGWRWFNWAIQNQIQADGAYIQHSTNYHRLMLQLALWVNSLLHSTTPLPQESFERLGWASQWLADICVEENGYTPNFGPNDGAYLQPLSWGDFRDYRPVIQASGKAFLGKMFFPPGAWDEMSYWYGLEGTQATTNLETKPAVHVQRAWNSFVVLKSDTSPLRAALRCTHFSSRPGHADQLHIDLWWKGINMACDAGSYRYTAPPPWDNALSNTHCHNTITVEGENQMSRAGKFLWLDWAQGKIVRYQPPTAACAGEILAEQDGYRRFGVIHQRGVRLEPDSSIVIEDKILPSRAIPKRESPLLNIQLHWLIADFPWRVEFAANGWVLTLDTPAGKVEVEIKYPEKLNPTLKIIRAGQVLFGKEDQVPNYGWFSPTYNFLQPALSILVDMKSQVPVSISTRWNVGQQRSK
jgi:hypothetical protein